ncbi:MAG: septation ring formation regulator EzrA [Bacilli bacterium]|nr:septation ring formation regulator EzrA [Bacilli bacterium]
MEEFCNYIKNFIDTVGTKNLIITAAVIVAVIVVYIIYRSIRLKFFRKKIVEEENRMNAIKSLPLQYRLGRVKSIAKNMPDVEPLYQQYSEEFEKLSDFQKNELGVLLNEIDEQLFYGKLRKVSKKMNELEEMLQTYEDKSQDLLKRIEKITEIENIQRIEIIRVKEKYRKEVDYYESIRFKVDDFIPHIDGLFKDIDKDFVSLEDMMNNQRFEEAQEFTKAIEKKIDWIHTNFKDLPSFVTVVRQYIPKKINQIQGLIDSMPENQYAMHQLAITDRFEAVHLDLEKEIKNVKSLQLDNMSNALEEISKNIDGLIEDITTEKKSLDLFKEKWDECYKNVEQIYSQYKQALIDLNNMRTLYVLDDVDITIDEKFEDFDVLLKQSYDLEQQMSTGKFAYSLMIKDVETLNSQVIVHQTYLNDFFTVRDHLYLQEQRAIDELENINIVLLEIKSEIKNKHLPMINESYKDYIQDSYDKAAEIQAFRQNRPVELTELSQKVDKARDVIYKLYDNVHNLVVTAQMVEEAIVFGNRYRSTFLEVNTELTKAEVLFRNGEYTKALTTAVDIIEKIKPGSYEELILKTSKKSN